MALAKAIILTGNGTNCEMEAAHACQLAGFDEVKIAHISELLYGEVRLDDFHFLNLTGGFLDGDDLGRVLFSGVPCDRRDEVLLFSESASRHLVTVRQEDREEFEEVMTGNCFSSIGTVVEDKTLTITGLDGSVVVRGELDELKEAWQCPLREM